MLRKLIAADFGTLKKPGLLMTFLSLGCAVLTSLGLIAMELIGTSESNALAIPMLGIALLLIGVSIGTFVCAAAIVFIPIINYYKKTATDEAYLTFTLPATAGQHILSKLTTATVWTIVGSVVLVVDLFIILVPGEMLFGGLTVVELLTRIRIAITFGYSTVPQLIFGHLGVLLSGITVSVAQLALIYLAITIGNVKAKKHKVIAGIGVYLGLNMAASLAMEILLITVNVGYLLASVDSYTVLYYINALLYAGLAVGCYQWNRHLLDYKLNLS